MSEVADRKPVALALQGGGSHGAFTWGVLDALLEDGRLHIQAISGTSAGSVNAVLTAYGLEQGGPEKARALLKQFWLRLAQYGVFSPLQPSLLDRMTGNNNLDYSPIFFGLDLMTRMLSPYQFNPLGLNPLRELLRELVDFEVLRRCRAIELYISATNVRSCGLKVFHAREVTEDAVLASSCLPFVFKAVEINGEHYWDGGYMGNPTLYPLIHETGNCDIVIVQINPIRREDVPMNAATIMDRINEISFNSSLIHELRGLMMVNKLIAKNHLDAGSRGLRQLHLHMIHDEALMARLSYASKLNTDHDFLLMLHDAGRQAAQHWLAEHYLQVGQTTTLDETLLKVTE
jgi:NTE family protein